MGDKKKSALGQAKFVAARTARVLVTLNPSLRVVTPNGTVTTNVTATQRFPLPLTIGSAVLGAIGAIAALRGHRIIGVGLVVVAGVGLGAAAAAPELNAALAKVAP